MMVLVSVWAGSLDAGIRIITPTFSNFSVNFHFYLFQVTSSARTKYIQLLNLNKCYGWNIYSKTHVGIYLPLQKYYEVGSLRCN